MNLLIENKLIGICNTDENFKLEEGTDLVLLTIMDTFNNKVKATTLVDSELESLRSQIKDLQNSTNTVKPSSSIEKKLPKDFKDAYRLFQIQFEKLLNNENHIALFNTL